MPRHHRREEPILPDLCGADLARDDIGGESSTSPGCVGVAWASPNPRGRNSALPDHLEGELGFVSP